MQLFLSVTLFIYFIIEYMIRRKGYLLLGSLMPLLTILYRVTFVKRILDENYLALKYGALILAIPFLFLFIRDILLRAKKPLL